MIVVVLLLVHHVIAELPKQTDYVIKRFDSCPSAGYFFKREENVVDPTCYLCFCQDSGEATCWPRKNEHCDVNTYLHLGERNDTRVRRSPNPIAAGLSDIFFRDATRDLFNRQIPPQCKPFQASYSEGCPPVDWCIGCTVCDCDANGHWDCHVLSFCEKDGPGQPPKDLKFPKKHRTRRRSYVPNSPIKKKPHTKPTRKPHPPKPKPTKPSKKKPKKGQTAKKKPAPIRKTAPLKKRSPPTRVPKKAPPPKKQPQRKTQPSKYLHISKKQTKPGKRPWFNEKRKRTTSTTSPRRKRKLDATFSPAQATQQILNDEDFKQILKRQLSQSIMNEFKSALQGAVIKDKGKGKHKKKDKRSIVKKVIIMNEIDSNETINGIDANNTWLENSDINGGLIKDSNMVKVYQRYKRKAVENKHEITNNSHSAGNLSIYKHQVEVTTQSEPSTIEKENYFKYAIESNNQKLLVIRDDPYNHQQSNISTTTANTISDDDQQLTVLQLIDKSKTISNNKDQRTIETTTKKSITKNETLGTILSTTLVPVFIDDGNKNKSITERSLASVVENITEANYLKFQNLSNNKAIKEKQDLNNKTTTLAPESIVKKEKKVLRTFDVTKKVNKIPKKYNVERLIKILPKPPSKNNKTDTSYVKKFINKFLGTTGKKGSKKAKNVIKYLQRYFRKLFARPKNKKKTNGTRKKISAFEKHLQTLCETFGPCHLDPGQVLKLQSKVELLNTETYKMLRSIKIIHGLLKLVDIAGNDKDLKNNSVNTNTYFKNDINKLQAILTNTYLDKINVDRLSNTQLAQIDYIKKNAFTFMISAGKFAGILNDIISIIQAPAVISKRELQRASRFTENTDRDVQFDKLKKILVRFNLVQNAFIQKIYKIIASKSAIIENNKISKPERHQEEQNIFNNTTKEQETVNSSEYINIYTKNIIKNLRKLKNLAQKIESRSIRRKRDLKDDDAMEYLLVLMEYMMNQKRHLDSAPVNDGIDLLIEAIKHAPDIKPIRKKVLKNLPTSTPVIFTTEYIELITIKDDSSSDLNSILKEDNITSQLNDLGIIKQPISDIDNEIERDDMNRKAFFDTTTDIDYYKKDDVNRFNFESSKELPIVLPKENVENDEATTNLAKIYSSHERGDDGGKLEEGEEDNAIPGLSTTIPYSENIVEADFRTEMNESTTEFNTDDLKMRHFNFDEINNDINVDKRINWVEASYEDIRDERNKTEVRQNKGETCTTSMTEKPRNEDISKEVRQEKKKWYHPEDVIYKKEMNLLNSLDYAVGRSKEAKEEESNSKEEADDKISDEAVDY